MRAGAWFSALRMFQRGFAALRVIILARLLAPEDFGLMGIALITLAFLEAFTETGFRSALIQKAGDIKEYLDVAWTAVLIRSVFLFLIIFLSAPYIAGFFDVEESFDRNLATWVIRVMALVVLIRGMVNIGTVLFDKQLEFQKRFFIQAGETFADVGVGITLAIIYQNVWALVFGAIAGAGMKLLLSYVLHPHRPRLRWETAKAKELYVFGRWILFNNVLFLAATRGDAAVVGRILGPTSLGIYELGIRMAQLMTREIGAVTGVVAFPAYSEVQRDVERLRRAFFMSLDMVSSITIPIAVLTSVLAVPLVEVVLEDAWLDVAIILPFLAAAGAMRAISAVGGSLFMGVGKPSLDFQMSILRTVILFVLIVPLANAYGLAGAGTAVIISALSMLPFLLWSSAKQLDVSPFRIGRTLVPSVLISASVAGAVVLAEWFGPTVGLETAIWRLVIGSLIGFAAYVAACAAIFAVSGAGPLRVLVVMRARR